jgi:hypothetical protein
MAAIAAANVTVVVTERWIAGKKKWARGTLAFGDGSLTYSTAGIPLPTYVSFGFVRNLDTLDFYGINERTTDYHLRYGPANHTLLLYEEEAAAAGGPLLEADTSEAPAARTYHWIASGW